MVRLKRCKVCNKALRSEAIKVSLVHRKQTNNVFNRVFAFHTLKTWYYCLKCWDKEIES